MCYSSKWRSINDKPKVNKKVFGTKTRRTNTRGHRHITTQKQELTSW